MDGFEVTAQDGVLTLRGELDAHTAAQLDEAVAGLVSDGQERLVLDVAELRFVDSSGLRSMIHAQGPDGSRVVELRSPSSSVLRLLEVTGLGDSFDITAP